MEAFISSKEKSKRIMRIKNKVPVVMGKASFRGVATAECFRTAKQKQPEGTSHRHPNAGFLHVQDKNWEMDSYQMLKQKHHAAESGRLLELLLTQSLELMGGRKGEEREVERLTL